MLRRTVSKTDKVYSLVNSNKVSKLTQIPLPFIVVLLYILYILYILLLSISLSIFFFFFIIYVRTTSCQRHSHVHPHTQTHSNIQTLILTLTLTPTPTKALCQMISQVDTNLARGAGVDAVCGWLRIKEAVQLLTRPPTPPLPPPPSLEYAETQKPSHARRHAQPPNQRQNDPQDPDQQDPQLRTKQLHPKRFHGFVTSWLKGTSSSRSSTSTSSSSSSSTSTSTSSSNVGWLHSNSIFHPIQFHSILHDHDHDVINC